MFREARLTDGLQKRGPGLPGDITATIPTSGQVAFTLSMINLSMINLSMILGDMVGSEGVKADIWTPDAHE